MNQIHTYFDWGNWLQSPKERSTGHDGTQLDGPSPAELSSAPPHRAATVERVVDGAPPVRGQTPRVPGTSEGISSIGPFHDIPLLCLSPCARQSRAPLHLHHLVPTLRFISPAAALRDGPPLAFGLSTDTPWTSPTSCLRRFFFFFLAGRRLLPPCRPLRHSPPQPPPPSSPLTRPWNRCRFA